AERYRILLERDRIDLGLVEQDGVSKLPPARPYDPFDVREPERYEEQDGLIHVAVVAVDDVDLAFVPAEAATQPVRDQRSTGAAPQDHDPGDAHDEPPARSAGTGSRCAIVSTNSMPASIERRSGHAA